MPILMIQKTSSAKVLIFITVFIYLVGFGIIIPILPILGKDLGGSATQVGILMAVFSLMQFMFAPYWGQLSDRFGRRPILIGCLIGEGLSYIWFALARDYWSLLLARAVAGFFGASISTASAYISDITPASQRSKGMAIIGAAFGLGFVVGPAVGAGLMILSKPWSPDPMFGSTVASLGVALLCFATFAFAYFYLPESLLPEKRGNSKRNKVHRLALIFARLKIPRLNVVILLFFINSLAMSLMEATLVLFVEQKFSWNKETISLGFAYVGLTMVFTQGFLVRKILPIVGERRLVFWGLSLLSIGMAMIVGTTGLISMTIAMTFLSVGNALSNPSLLGSISLLSSEQEQGVNMGVAQSMSSMARILGPVIGGFVFQQVAPVSPFLLSAGLGFIGVLVLIVNFKHLPHAAEVK